jgi:hypothetical protein
MSAIQPLSLFLSDPTVDFAAKKGFRLSTLRLRSSHSGHDYEYSIFNSRDLLIPQQIEDLLLKQELVDSIRAAEVRGAVGGGGDATSGEGTNWKQDPSSLDYSAAYQLEIVSGTGLYEVGASRVLITYQLYYPSPSSTSASPNEVGTWKLRAGNVIDGTTNHNPSSNIPPSSSG